MRKILRPKDVLLLGLAGALDVYEEIKDPFGMAARGSKQIYGWVPARYKKHNFSRLVRRGLKTGEIEKVVKGGEVYLRLTSQGKAAVVRDFPVLAMQGKKWDGKWRVVIYDIAEVNRFVRETLRAKLRELGFGMLQESVWITPYDLLVDFREFLEAKRLSEVVYVFEVSVVLAGNIEVLIDRIWHVFDLNKEYCDLLTEIDNAIRAYVTYDDRHKKHTVKKETFTKKIKELEKEVGRIKQKYLEILMRDPCLPKELLPKNWAGEKVRNAVAKLRAIPQSVAQI